MDFQDAQDNEVAAQKALLLLSTMGSRNSTTTSTLNTTAPLSTPSSYGEVPYDDVGPSQMHHCGSQHNEHADLDTTVQSPHLRNTGNESIYDVLSDIVPPKPRHVTFTAPGELKRVSIEDGPEGEDVMENWNKATQKVDT